MSSTRKIRRQQVREHRAKSAGSLWHRFCARCFSWPVLVGVSVTLTTSAVALFGDASLRYSVGERIDEPIYAKVDFKVPDPAQTEADRQAARASVPSHYTLNTPAISFDRIRQDMMRVFQIATESDAFEQYAEAMKELDWPADRSAHTRLRKLADDTGRSKYQQWVDQMPIEKEYIARAWHDEPREPASAVSFILLETEGQQEAKRIQHADLVAQASEKNRSHAAADLASTFPYELRATVKAILLVRLKEQPTILYDQERTVLAMQQSEEATPEAYIAFERGKPFVNPHATSDGAALTSSDYDLLRHHRTAYLAYLDSSGPLAAELRRMRLLERIGMVTIVSMLSVTLLVYIWLYQRRVFEVRARSVAMAALVLGTLIGARALDLKWPQHPELILAPCFLAGSVLAIVYPPRFALGALCIVSALVTVTVRADLLFMLTLSAGLTVMVHQLSEIRSRTKIITAGVTAALVVAVVTAAGGLLGGQLLDSLLTHAAWAAGCTLLSSFVVSGVLPFLERLFRIATALTLLEWRDTTKPLLQLLAREAPGTYNHSLMLGTLTGAACEAIGANGLLAQVGSLYHDIGKIHKADYFAENQEGQINRHDNLAPTMSLLIILGHVKDGVEMAKEYKLPRVLHQFIQEHHGTTVIRYFHHAASEKQPLIASGKHDREVSEAEFRYRGPKPRSRESAVVMLCDGVEGAVRALPEPTVGRIESVVHGIVSERLADGQFDDCGITLRELKQVEEALVKALSRVYHGRPAYPKKEAERTTGQERLTG